MLLVILKSDFTHVETLLQVPIFVSILQEQSYPKNSEFHNGSKKDQNLKSEDGNI